MRREDFLDSTCVIVEDLDIIKVLVCPRISDPDVARLKPKHHVDRVMEIVGLNEGQRGEHVSLVTEAFRLLLRELSLLVLELKVFGYSPVVVASIRNSYEFISVAFDVWIPGSGFYDNWEH